MSALRTASSWVGGEFEAAGRVDAHFEGGDAEQTPLGIGERLDEIVLGVAAGFVVVEGALNVLPISIGIVTGQQNGAASETCFDIGH
ncbi:MAG: hypothetical protein ACRD4O_05525 [Bryobacteraceae bacterium]